MKYNIQMIGDFQCPYCYLGKNTLNNLKNKYDIEITFRGYEIHADIPEKGIRSEDYFSNAKEKNIQLQQIGRQYGVEFADILVMPNTNKALQVAEYAKTVHKSEEYNDAMYKAFFFEKRNIGLEHEIEQIAGSVSISKKEIDSVLSQDKYKKLLQENHQFCLDNNLSSVPAFIINDKFVIVGAQRAEVFEDVFKKLAKQNDSVIENNN